ncbi:MAG TPA: DUF4276 family protein [Sedimentisphaerales bacterium]|nr:DUF4276 family protein [Sedimentisphaerales bacterium]
MSIIKILVEGPTEILFVNDVLKPFFVEKGIAVRPFLLQEGGGVPKYPRSQKQILNTIKADRYCYCTTLVDFYGLPKDWPGRKDADRRRAYLEKAATVEEALSADICTQLGPSFDQSRFIPYVQMHEFEALLFSDISVLAGPNPTISMRLAAILVSFSCPEEINDNYDTCPSRRIMQHIENYVKPVDGIVAAHKIGLARMRQECPHFNEWITKLEGIGKQ